MDDGPHVEKVDEAEESVPEEEEDDDGDEARPEEESAGEYGESGANSGETGLEKYRSMVVAAMQKSQDDYDKAVMSLSGGALGLTFAFFQKASEPRQYLPLLEAAWILWTLRCCQ